MHGIGVTVDKQHSLPLKVSQEISVPGCAVPREN